MSQRHSSDGPPWPLTLDPWPWPLTRHRSPAQSSTAGRRSIPRDDVRPDDLEVSGGHQSFPVDASFWPRRPVTRLITTWYSWLAASWAWVRLQSHWKMAVAHGTSIIEWGLCYSELCCHDCWELCKIGTVGLLIKMEFPAKVSYLTCRQATLQWIFLGRPRQRSRDAKDAIHLSKNITMRST